ncbi:MAG: hypothetical protein IJV20_06475 [Prevotella sp.]|nr:hypothetical protein [Prevotella sp.]
MYELLSKCKFYKGEEDCPKGVFFFGWECEYMYVKHMATGDNGFFRTDIDIFCKFGLDKVPELQDGTPIEIQALLFERYCHNCDTDPKTLASSFPNYYVRKWHNNK